VIGAAGTAIDIATINRAPPRVIIIIILVPLELVGVPVDRPGATVAAPEESVKRRRMTIS
jgi:hypothetical protein